MIFSYLKLESIVGLDYSPLVKHKSIRLVLLQKPVAD